MQNSAILVKNSIPQTYAYARLESVRRVDRLKTAIGEDWTDR